MRERTPYFVLVRDPGRFDELTLLATTIFLEAEGEGDRGMLAVGWVCRNRAILWRRTWHEVILGADAVAYDDNHPFEVFSCWNDDYRIQAQQRLERADGPPREAAWKAAAGAYWALDADPTKGSTHYLNPVVTKQIRGGTLPSWAASPGDATTVDPAKVRVVINRHTFLVA